MSPFSPFTLTLSARIRPAREADLPTLEWFGLFSHDRPLLRTLFAQQHQGTALILIADVNDVPSGQLWIDFHLKYASHRPPHHRAAFFWAIRIFPTLQNKGLGTRLIAAAEALLLQRHIHIAQLSVEQDNPRAAALYRRLGYRQINTPENPAEQLLLEKSLTRHPHHQPLHNGAAS